MADIDIVPKSASNWVMWVIIAIVVVAALWWFLGRDSTRQVGSAERPHGTTASAQVPELMHASAVGVIRRWVARHSAEPATGEATASGPATIGVNDGGAGIRFNFLGFARFRPISWDEWFANFDRHGLVFVYEEEVADRAYALWQSRGGGHGHDRADWLDAERQLRAASGGSSARYRIVKEPDTHPSGDRPDCA